MTHKWSCEGAGPLTTPAVALLKADRNAFLAAHQDVALPHDDVLFNAAVASMQSFLTALDPTGLGQGIAVRVDSGCSDELHLTPHVSLSKSWSVAAPVGDIHSWLIEVATVGAVLSAAEEALASALLTARLAAQGRVVEAGDTAVFGACIAGVRSWITALAPTTPLVVSFAVSVSNGSLQRVNVSTTIVTAQPAAPVPDPAIYVLTPPTLTADVNNYNPAGLASAVCLRLSSTGARSVTGIAGGAGLRQLVVYNVGGSNITLVNGSLLSTPGNRFLANGNLLLNPHEGCILMYDPVTLGWRIIGAAV